MTADPTCAGERHAAFECATAARPARSAPRIARPMAYSPWVHRASDTTLRASGAGTGTPCIGSPGAAGGGGDRGGGCRARRSAPRGRPKPTGRGTDARRRGLRSNAPRAPDPGLLPAGRRAPAPSRLRGRRGSSAGPLFPLRRFPPATERTRIVGGQWGIVARVPGREVGERTTATENRPRRRSRDQVAPAPRGVPCAAPPAHHRLRPPRRRPTSRRRAWRRPHRPRNDRGIIQFDAREVHRMQIGVE